MRRDLHNSRCERFPVARALRLSTGDETWPFRKEKPRPAAWLAPLRRRPEAPTYVEDKDSGELRRPHHVDLKTGMYRGRQVLKVKSDA